MSRNARIEKAELKFGDADGKNGRQFTLTLQLNYDDMCGVFVTFNPLRLPQLLEMLELTKFSELEGTYVQTMNTSLGEECRGIRHILADSNDGWFKTENHIYFGSEFMGMLKEEYRDKVIR